MIKKETAPGFTKNEIDEMNKEVSEIVDSDYIAYYHDLDDFMQAIEAEVIEIHKRKT